MIKFNISSLKWPLRANFFEHIYIHDISIHTKNYLKYLNNNKNIIIFNVWSITMIHHPTQGLAAPCKSGKQNGS